MLLRGGRGSDPTDRPPVAKEICATDPSRPETLQYDDSAHLIGSLPRAAPLPGGEFLSKQPDSNQPYSEFIADISAHITVADEHGCGYEAPLAVASATFFVEFFPSVTLGQRSDDGVRDPSTNSATAAARRAAWNVASLDDLTRQSE